MTESHLQRLHERLESVGIDVTLAATRNQYIALDARETLSAFMRDGWPDRNLFFQTIEPVLGRAHSGLRGDSSIVAFGEMVSLLCEEGQYEPAGRLEDLWNEIAYRQETAAPRDPMTDRRNEAARVELTSALLRSTWEGEKFRPRASQA